MADPVQKADQTAVGETIELVKAYVLQETIGPLRGFGRRLALGLGGALALGMGLFFLSLGLLRLLQTHAPTISNGTWSWVSYLIVFVFAGGLSGIAVWRVRKIEKELN